MEGHLMRRVSAETVRRLAEFDAHGLPVVSVYSRVEVDPGDRALGTHADSLLHEVRRQVAGNGPLSHAARSSLKDDERRIYDALTQQEWPAGTAAIVSCSGAGLYEEVALSRTIRNRAVVDGTPWIRPMIAVLDEEHSACVVVVDRGAARVWTLADGELRWSGGQRDETPRKPDYAGWAGLEGHRVQRRTDELARRHYRRVARHVGIVCLANGCELLVTGGHREELPCFIDELPNDLQARVAGMISIDARTATTEDIRRAAEEVVDRHEREQERKTIEHVLGVAAAHGPAVAGLEDCLWAGTMRAIGTLLVQQDVEAPGVVCDHGDGWMALAGATCPLCGNPTRQVPDVVDDLVEAVIEESGSIEHVVAEDTPLREHRTAAGLRFGLPPRPPAHAGWSSGQQAQ
jgi:peptide chain release factor subunit 1